MQAKKTKLQKKISADYWVNALPIPVFVLNHANEIIYCNTAFEEFVQTKKKSILGSSLEVALGKNDSRNLLKEILKAYSGANTKPFKSTIHRHDGRVVKAVLQLSPIFEGKKRIVTNLVGIVENHTLRPRFPFFS